jgi:eukaryotic-like serine/threonine-protein kinase
MNRYTHPLNSALFLGCIVIIVSGCAGTIAKKDLEWSVQVDGGCGPGSGAGSEPTVGNGTVYVGSSDGAVYAIDTGSGALRWRFQTGVDLPTGMQRIEVPRRTGPAEMAGRAIEEIERSGARGRAQITASPVLIENTVYVGSWDGMVYALDSTTGKPRWAFDAGLPVIEKAIVHSGLVIFATGGAGARHDRGDGLVYALDASSGSKIWMLDSLPDVEPQSKWPSHPPVVGDGVGYIVNWNGAPYVKGVADPARIYVHAIDVKSGASRWNGKFEGAWPSPPSIAKDYILLTTSPREDMGTVELRALDNSTGREAWRYKIAGGIQYTFGTRTRNESQAPMLVKDNLVLLSTDTNLVGIDIETGKELWRLGEPFRAEPINQIHIGSLVYVVTGETLAPKLGHLHGIDPSTGKIVWSTRMLSRNRIHAVIDDTIYYMTLMLRKSLIAVDGVNGRELGTVWTSSPFGSESYTICSGPVRHGSQLYISTASQTFAGGRPLRGYLYSVTAPTVRAK